MSAPTMASPPPLDSHSALRTPSDYGYQPVFSAPDLAIRQAVDSAQTQWTEQFNQLQTYTRLLEAQLQQMSDGQKALQNQMVQMIFQQQQQQWQPQPQRKQGRPHPGKSMRAKKRKQAQAVLEQANSSSSEAASDADCPTAAPAPAPAAAASTSTHQQPPGGAAAAAAATTAAATVVAAEPQGPGITSPKLEVPELAPIHKAAVTPENAAAAAAVTSPRVAPSSPAGHAEQTDEGGWIDVGKQMPSSPTSGAPRSVPAAAMEDGNKSLVKAAVEEAMQAMKKEFIETTQIAAKEALAATLAEGLQQHSQCTQRDITAAVEVLKQTIHVALTGTLAPLATLQDEQQSKFEQLRRDLQEVQRKNEELLADSAQHLRPIGDDVAAMKLELAELKARIAHLAGAAVQQASCSGQQPPGQEQEAPEAPVAAADADAVDQLGTQDLPPPPGLSSAPAAGQTDTPTPMQTTVQAEEDVREATAAAGASLTTLAPRTPPRCRVVAGWWVKGWHTEDWKLDEEKELAEPFLVTATTLRDVKVKAANTLGLNIRKHFKELKEFDGSRSVPSQRRSLQDLGCGEGSVVKLHFRIVAGVRSWWSYEVIGCNNH